MKSIASKCWLSLLLTVTLSVAGPCLGQDSPNPRSTELWIGHYNPEHLGTDGISWDKARRITHGIEFYINMVAYKVPAEELKPFCETLRANQVAVGVNGGYFDWVALPAEFKDQGPENPIREKVRMDMQPGVGAETARTEIKKLDNLIRAAGKIDVVTLDGPIRRLMYPGADTGRATPRGDAQGFDELTLAMDEIVSYMKTWRAAQPEVRFVVLTNFPNWGWDGEIAYWASGPDGMYWGDYKPAIQQLIQRCQDEQIPLEGIRVDNPFEFATGQFELKNTKWPDPIKDPSTVDWISRIRELEDITHQAHLKFELIVNSEDGGATSNQAFAERSLQYLALYRKRGGAPERVVLEGWYQYPDRLGPDTQPYTLSHTALEFARRLLIQPR